MFAWTVSATWAGLQAAVRFADTFGDETSAETYRRAALEIREAAEKMLWLPDAACFARSVVQDADGLWKPDGTVDASIFGLWYFGMFAPDDSRIVSTMNMIRERLWVKTNVGGVARYEDDRYQRRGEYSKEVPGNPWFICTLWLAQWHIAVATRTEDLAPASEILKWAADHALRSGVMAEQVDPETGAPLSVSPLTWSHATLVMTVQEYARRLTEFAG